MNIPKVIFIVPYRDREEEKQHFTKYMEYIMEDYDKNDYEIYLSHQLDNRPFNRGAMKNIGFLVLKKKYPEHYKDITFVFNDIDTIPYEKNLLNYITEKNKVKHFYGFEFALGGIFSITGYDFELCNGFPNNWGWGLEDNTFNNRVISNNIKIDRDNFYKIGSKQIIHINDNPLRKINDYEVTNYFKNDLKDNLNTITHIKYNIDNIDNIHEINKYIINITYFTTFTNHTVGKYYEKDLSKNNKLKPHKRMGLLKMKF